VYFFLQGGEGVFTPDSCVLESRCFLHVLGEKNQQKRNES